MNKIEKIVLESLTYRGYAEAEAKKFISVLKGESDIKYLSDSVIDQISDIVEKQTAKINEYERLISENHRLQKIHTEHINSLEELGKLFDEMQKKYDRLKRFVKSSFLRVSESIKNIADDAQTNF
jgi:cell shape-determining protein MreC